MLFGSLILLIAIVISSVAAYYSVMGLTAIFAAATIPVIIMGGALEAGKIAATVWLHNNWSRASWAFKLYLIPAIAFLMLLTSMGIFGFLSKAHLDQNIPSGDAQAKVQIIDDQIRTARDNIAASQAALKQMDAQVNEMLSRSTDNKGTERAVAIRKNQAKERTALQLEITKQQGVVANLSQQREPLAAQYRKIEAEVGPIKYVAALIYGDGAANNMLEQAVRWVIIVIVVVFDPLALCLILAANKQFEWARHGSGGWVHDEKDKEHEETPGEEEKPHSPSTGQSPPQATDTPDDNKEVDEFFWRGRMIAKALDAEADQMRVDAGNMALSEIEPEQPDVDAILEELELARQAEQQATDAVEHAQQQLTEYRDTLNLLADEYDLVKRDLEQALERESTLAGALQQAADERSLINTRLEEAKQSQQAMALETVEAKLMAATTEDHLSKVRDDMAALGDLNRELDQRLLDATQKEAELHADLDAANEDVRKLQAWVQQLESDLRAAISVAEERNNKINELLSDKEKEHASQPTNDTVGAVVGDVSESVADATGMDVSNNNGTVIHSGDEGQGWERTYFNRYNAPPADNADDLPDSGRADFGVKFPDNPNKGDVYLRVDMLPPKLYKWNQYKWIEIDRGGNDRLAYDQRYIEYLVGKLRSGEYELDDLNDAERTEVSNYLNGRTS